MMMKKKKGGIKSGIEVIWKSNLKINNEIHVVLHSQFISIVDFTNFTCKILMISHEKILRYLYVKIFRFDITNRSPNDSGILYTRISFALTHKIILVEILEEHGQLD